jgi:hypothetical protein
MTRRPASVLSPEVIEAARTASKALSAAGIRHVLIGGLAVNAYGFVRNTSDVDFLVGSEAYVEQPGGFVTLAPGVPIAIGAVDVDTLEDAAISEGETTDPESEWEGVPIVSIEGLFFLKLKAWRRKDQMDLVELLKSGADEDAIRDYLVEEIVVGPDLLGRFDTAVLRANEEES